MKKKLVFVLIVVLLLSFSTIFADDLADVKQAGVLRFGHHLEYVPFIFEGSDGKTTGIDTALMEEIARRMGVKLETIPLAWDGIIDSLNLGQADVIGGGLARTDERLEKIDFTRAYYSADSLFISLTSTAKPANPTLDSFRGMKIAVEKGTNYETWIRENLVTPGYINAADVFTFSGMNDQIKALENGTVNLVVMAQDLYIGLYQNTGKYQIFYDKFLQENFAFGVRKGSTLAAAINEQMNAMIKDGTAQSIANKFFSMNFNEIVQMLTRPQATQVVVPTVPVTPSAGGCVNGMVYVADVTIPDGQAFNPGAGFRKTWRVKNSGTCSWDSNYSFSLASGSSMGTNSIYVPGIVAPGQTVDLSVDLTAPNAAGAYKGYWQMRSPQGASFGQVIWVSIKVNGAAPNPRPDDGQKRVIPQVNYFYLVPDEGYAGEATYAYWSVSNAAGVQIYVDGNLYVNANDAEGYVPITDEIQSVGSHEIRLVAHSVTDDASATAWFKMNDSGQDRVIPQIDNLFAIPDPVGVGEDVNIHWNVRNAAGIQIYVDGNLYVESNDAEGFVPVFDQVQEVGTHEITLVAHSITDDASSTIYITTQDFDMTEDDYTTEDY